MPSFLGKPIWWGSPAHQLFTVIVFVILASLDNAARGVLPPLYAVVSRDLQVSEAALGMVTGVTVIALSVTSVGWGYWGDRRARKPLLFYGTLIWVAGMGLTGQAATFKQLFLWQLVAAVGIGCIASVGFSVISDLIPAGRRGMMLGFWGISQGGGAGLGALLGGSLGAYEWPLPFFGVAAAGLLFALLYLFTFEPERGRAEPELVPLFEAGRTYDHRISRADLRRLWAVTSNRWLLLVAFVGPLAYGSRVWLARLFIAKVEAGGYSLETATITGNMFSLLFETGFYFAILSGYLGDRWQRHNPRGRARLGMGLVWLAIPFQIVVFLMPLRNLNFPTEANVPTLTGAVLWSLVSNPWVGSTFLVALLAIALLAGDSPTRAALYTEVNLPEHRGTVTGFMTIATGLGLALGNWLAGLTISSLAHFYAPPLNYALGLALFQLWLIPAGWCYYQISKSVAEDLARLKRTLSLRAESEPDPFT